MTPITFKAPRATTRAARHLRPALLAACSLLGAAGALRLVRGATPGSAAVGAPFAHPLAGEGTLRLAFDGRAGDVQTQLRLERADCAGRAWQLVPDEALAALPQGGEFDEHGAASVPLELSGAWLAGLSIGLHTREFELRVAPQPASGGASAPVSVRAALSILIESPRSLGVNLAYVDYYSSLLVFRDLFRQASRWIPQEVSGNTWNTGAELELDEHGWIARLEAGQAAAVLLARDIEGHYPGGRWRLEYQGQGRLEARLDGRLESTRPGERRLRVTPSNAGIHLVLLESDPDDPLRDIRLYPEGLEEGSGPFQPAALQLLAPFQALRFMDWQRTNNSAQRHWEERPLPSDAVQTGASGVALEFMLELANELGADPWLCVPHLADDDYVRAFATLVRDGLAPERRVYLEYSNEVWNGMFEQARWAREQGLALGLADDAFLAQMRLYSQRSVEVFEICSEVFSESPARLVRVLAGPAINSWAGRQLLDWKDAWQSADAYAIAPYFGHALGQAETAAQVAALPPRELFERLDAEMRTSLARVAEHARLARERGLELLAYEGGQHLVGQGAAVENQALVHLFQSVNRDPRMGALYTRSLELWREAGGGLFFAWNAVERSSKWGSWGAREFMDQEAAQAPKYEALRRFSSEVAPWW